MSLDQTDPVAETGFLPHGIATLPDTDLNRAEESGYDALTLTDDGKLLPTPASWVNVYPNLELTGISANIMANCELVSATDDALDFLLGEEHSAVFNEDAPAKVEPAFEKLLGRKIAIRISIGTTKKETPAARKIRVNQELQSKRVSDFENDRLVVELKQRFGGRVVTESIVESIVKNTVESGLGLGQS